MALFFIYTLFNVYILGFSLSELSFSTSSNSKSTFGVSLVSIVLFFFSIFFLSTSFSLYSFVLATARGGSILLNDFTLTLFAKRTPFTVILHVEKSRAFSEEIVSSCPNSLSNLFTLFSTLFTFVLF